jgi:hypothetical protein
MLKIEYHKQGPDATKDVSVLECSRLYQGFQIGRFATPLKHQQVQRRWFPTGQNGQAGMGLSSMMGLVVK